MRVSTRQPFTPRRAPRQPPSARKRMAYGVVGALLGGWIGYGIATAGPAPPPWSDIGVLLWMGGLALAVGAIFALATDRVFSGRSVRSAGMRLDDPPEDD